MEYAGMCGLAMIGGSGRGLLQTRVCLGPRLIPPFGVLLFQAEQKLHDANIALA